MLATMHKNANIMVVNVYYAVATLDTHIEYLYKKNTHTANQRLDENESANQMLSCFLLVRPQWPLRKYNEHAQPIFFMRFSFSIALEHSCNQYNTFYPKMEWEFLFGTVIANANANDAHTHTHKLKHNQNQWQPKMEIYLCYLNGNTAKSMLFIAQRSKQNRDNGIR